MDKQIDTWLAEDETDEYERIVSSHRRKRVALWLSMAAMVTLLVGLGWWWIPTKQETESSQLVVKKMDSPKPYLIVTKETPQIQKQEPINVIPTEKGSLYRAKNHECLPKTEVTLNETKANDHPGVNVDSLEYYIARLEKNLDEVGDSVYMECAEQVIRADIHLQRLVRKIYMNEIDQQEIKNEALYLKF
ncbi:MAG: hypothetical protein IIU48_02010 [Prevotella sp.]|nr:hypothetical protein [Prevotella sp.]